MADKIPELTPAALPVTSPIGSAERAAAQVATGRVSLSTPKPNDFWAWLNNRLRGRRKQPRISLFNALQPRSEVVTRPDRHLNAADMPEPTPHYLAEPPMVEQSPAEVIQLSAETPHPAVHVETPRNPFLDHRPGEETVRHIVADAGAKPAAPVIVDAAVERVLQAPKPKPLPKTAYEWLGLGEQATQGEIQRAYSFRSENTRGALTNTKGAVTQLMEEHGLTESQAKAGLRRAFGQIGTPDARVQYHQAKGLTPLTVQDVHAMSWPNPTGMKVRPQEWPLFPEVGPKPRVAAVAMEAASADQAISLTGRAARAAERLAATQQPTLPLPEFAPELTRSERAVARVKNIGSAVTDALGRSSSATPGVISESGLHAAMHHPEAAAMLGGIPAVGGEVAAKGFSLKGALDSVRSRVSLAMTRHRSGGFDPIQPVRGTELEEAARSLPKETGAKLGLSGFYRRYPGYNPDTVRAAMQPPPPATPLLNADHPPLPRHLDAAVLELEPLAEAAHPARRAAPIAAALSLGAARPEGGVPAARFDRPEFRTTFNPEIPPLPQVPSRPTLSGTGQASLGPQGSSIAVDHITYTPGATPHPTPVSAVPPVPSNPVAPTPVAPAAAAPVETPPPAPKPKPAPKPAAARSETPPAPRNNGGYSSGGRSSGVRIEPTVEGFFHTAENKLRWGRVGAVAAGGAVALGAGYMIFKPQGYEKTPSEQMAEQANGQANGQQASLG